MSYRSEDTAIDIAPWNAPTMIDYRLSRAAVEETVIDRQYAAITVRHAALTEVSSNISLLGRRAFEEKPKPARFSLVATERIVALGLLLATLLTSASCGVGTASSRCEGPQCLGENEHALTCAPTSALSPFEDHDPVPPPDPLACRPPEHNPGGVNGTRSERPPQSESRLAR